VAKELLKGNHAFAEAAIRAGVEAFFGYPITPSTEFLEHMARRMPELGRAFVQAESEVAAINMVYGAACTGKRVMTASSSPGVSLMMEGISYIAGTEVPAVVVNVMRGGPGLGNIAPSQGDYYQMVKGGGHGDYFPLVLAPASVQEAIDSISLAFDLADRYRTPVMVLGDGMIGQMMEGCRFDHLEKPRPPEKPWALTGEPGRPRRTIKSFSNTAEGLAATNQRLLDRYEQIQREEARHQVIGPPDPDVVLAAYGTCARICRQIVETDQDDLPFSVGLFRPVTLWPFPARALRQTAESARGVMVVEMSAGQMVDDVRLGVDGACRVELLSRLGGLVPTAVEIKEALASAFSPAASGP